MLLQSFNRRIICSFNVKTQPFLNLGPYNKNPISIPISNLQSSVNLIYITLKILALEWICIRRSLTVHFLSHVFYFPHRLRLINQVPFILYIFWYLVKCSGSVEFMRNCGLKILQIDLTQYLTR